MSLQKKTIRILAPILLVLSLVAISATRSVSAVPIDTGGPYGGGLIGCHNCTVDPCCGLTSANGGENCSNSFIESWWGEFCWDCQAYGNCQFMLGVSVSPQ